jgi:lipoic acid synthetase
MVNKPRWLRKRVFTSKRKQAVLSLLKTQALDTVCQQAKCPNLCECFDRGTATFLILGKYCTRNCAFCAISHGQPVPLNPDEPEKVAAAAGRLGLNHVVITSVTRDDLPDGGAAHFGQTIRCIRNTLPEATIEVLTPDFRGKSGVWPSFQKAPPDIFNHNLETVPRLYTVRPGASFDHSLALLAAVKEFLPAVFTKSGLMVGLGETKKEIIEVIKLLYDHRCDILTIGQYLSPSRQHAPVKSYVCPERFEVYKNFARDIGFRYIFCGPFVRSSYMAEGFAREGYH